MSIASDQDDSSVNSQKAFTSDFKPMLRIVFWNSFGLFYMGFLISYTAYADLNANGLILGSIVSVQVFGYLLSSILTGGISDYFSKKKLVLIGSFGRGISYFLIYFALLQQNLFLLGIGTFILGFGAGFFWIPLNALIAEKSSKYNRSQAYGIKSQYIGLGTSVGATIGFTFLISGSEMMLSESFLYIPIILYGISNLYAGIRFRFQVDESNVIINDLSNDITDEVSQITPKNSEFLWGMIFMFVVMFLAHINGSVSSPYIQPYLIEKIEDNVVEITLAYLPGGIASMILAPKLGKYVDKFHPGIVIAITSVIGAITTYILIQVNSFGMFALVLIIDNTIVQMSFLAVQNVLSRTTLKHRGKILGLTAVSENVGQIVGPLIGGYAWDTYSIQTPFIISIAVELILIPFYWYAIKYIIPHLAEKKAEDKKEAIKV